MAYDIVIGGDLQFDLATTRGWSLVRKWVDGLDLDKYGELIAFVEHGFTEDIPLLKTQAQAALKDDAPDSNGVATTIADLIESLGQADPSHVSAFVTDGLGPDNGDDSGDEWWSTYDEYEDEDEDEDEEDGDGA